MGVTTSRRGLARLGLSVLLAMAAAARAPHDTRAADPVLPAPAVSVVFLEAITFTGSARLSGDVKRVELVLDIEGSDRSYVADAARPGSGGTVALEYVLAAPSGAILPNTDMEARFRATLRDGSVVYGPATTVHYADTRLPWQTLDGEFVTVHWTAGGAAFGRRAQAIADAAVRDVGGLLGVESGDRIDFFIYANRDDFYDVLGAATRENVGGEAHSDIRTLFANIGPDAINSAWVASVIPHELTHLVFDSAVTNPYHYPPRWLDEGIAVYLAEGYGQGDRSAVEDAVRSGALMPLQALAGQFPTTEAPFRLAYSESVAAVDFLVDRFGQEAMVTLVRSYAAGVTEDEAFEAAIGLDMAGFEAAWLESLGAAAPIPYGPVPAPAGPVPADWIGSAPVPSEIPGVSATSAPSPSPGGSGPDATPGTDAGATVAVLILLAGASILGALLYARRRRAP
ncbi:MAG: Peptidase 2 protein [Chloroflexi bacterium]|nr:Peptidase 2 protein [Chloroflexota bacterium]